MKRLLILLALCAPVAWAGVLISVKDTVDIPPPAFWLGVDIGSDTGTSFNAVDNETLTITAKGESDESEGYFDYKPWMGDLQISGEFVSFSGTLEAFTSGGLRLAQDLTATPVSTQLAWLNGSGQNGSKTRILAGQAMAKTISSDAAAVEPHCQLLTFRSSPRLVNEFESDDPECDGGWTQVRGDVAVPLNGTFYIGVHCASHEDDNSVVCSFDNITISDTITVTPGTPPVQCNNNADDGDPEDTLADWDGAGLGAPDPDCASEFDTSETAGATGDREGIIYYAGFAEGQILDKDERVGGIFTGGGYVKGMGEPLGGTPSGPCTPVSSTTGINTLENPDKSVGDIDGTHFTRVVTSGSSSPIVAAPPDGGSRFLRLMVPYNCNYNQLSCNPAGKCADISCTYCNDIEGDKDKARTAFQLSGLEGIIPFDAGAWFGHYRYYPAAGMEAETDNHEYPVFEIKMGAGNSAITVAVADNNILQIMKQFARGQQNLPFPEAVDQIGSFNLVPFMDRWLEEIWHVRIHPTGNGEIEYWIDGVKKIDLHNTDVGGDDVGLWKGFWSIYEIYTGYWKKKPTSIDGPRYQFVDEIRVGLESEGASYDDVSPGREICPGAC